MLDIDQIRKHSPQDGDAFVLPEGTDYNLAKDFAEALHLACPGVKCLVVMADVRRLDVAAMNAAGWYRA
ncbi:hypothetical protein HFV04_017145 [Pseudomonas sp. BIGb0427]|uniref:hypothetical protein n=1 Tax=Pseudomonas sp. BIGb0427 TaxID=2724470 RepID=UPI0018A7AB93|nr:hypothetical protein [Pseudomonas sp. BIGb0427]QPG61243.1 hypothetical protein HFV04_017145 [Pseudomonas sp. BIGb0427]